MGFNRISLGVQDLDPAVQAAVNREQTIEQTRAVVVAARQAGMRSVNIDLIYGLPSPAMTIALLGLAVEALTADGYLHIGMDHFALPLDELAVAQREGSLHRNFMGYTTHADTDLVGFGVSAIRRIGQAYAQNQHDLGRWAQAVDAGRWSSGRPRACG